MKLPANPVKMKIQYCDEPEIKLTPIRFKQYAHGFGNGETDLKKYSKFTETWALVSFAENEKVEHVPERLQKVISTSGTMTAENESTLQDENAEGVAIDQEDEHVGDIPVDGMKDDRINDLGKEDMDIEDNNESLMDNGENPSDQTDVENTEGEPHPRDKDMDTPVENPEGIQEQPVIEVVKKPQKKEQLKKRAVMPTWSATQHLLGKHQQEEDPTKTNSEVVSPIVRNSPKDWSTLYTILCTAQEISTVVIGPNHLVVITLDMDLYKCATQLQESIKNKHWLLQHGHLHKIFADLHALGKVVEGSGLDTIAVESGVYSSTAMRVILAGKHYTRGVEYHLMNSLGLISLKLEATFGKDIPVALQNQDKAFREALHDDKDDMVELYEDLASHYQSEIKQKMPNTTKRLPKFFDNNLEQVEVLLTCIAAIHSWDLEACLAAIDRGVKYYSSMDLGNY